MWHTLKNYLSSCLIGLAILSQLVADEPTARQRMIARIDQLIDSQLHDQGLQAQPLCDDATFQRRVTLDLTGRNPTSGEIVSFLRDAAPDKRQRLIERLLSAPTCAVHLANIWSAWLLPEMQELNLPGMGGPTGLHVWLRNRLADNLRYDRLVADLLVATGPVDSGPGYFFVALEGKPEKIAAKTARVFLGVQLDCAECHNHPFDHWQQRDFWSFAAYFAQLSAEGMMPASPGQVVDRAEGEVKMPGSEEVIKPQPLVTTGLSGLSSGSRREQLTLWLTARENPYLARAAVNRCWSIVFGRGLIEPIDDMRSLEMASHPQLLDELAQYFAAQEYNLRDLLQVLVSTQAYQRRSVPPGQPADAAALTSYAAMPLKPLTSTQLATCMQQVARDIAGEEGRVAAQQLANQLGKLRGDNSAATLGIVQALVTLHSDQLDRVHGAERSRLLQALTAPHLNTEKRIEWMFLSTLCRAPTADERSAILQMHDAEDATWQADLLWALINSTEFAMTP